MEVAGRGRFLRLKALEIDLMPQQRESPFLNYFGAIHVALIVTTSGAAPGLAYF